MIWSWGVIIGLAGLVVSLLGAIWLGVRLYGRKGVHPAWVVVLLAILLASFTLIATSPFVDVVTKVSSGDADDP